MAVPDWEPISGWNPWGSTRLLFLRWDRTTPIGTSHYWISYIFWNYILAIRYELLLAAGGFSNAIQSKSIDEDSSEHSFATKSDGTSLIPTKDRIYTLCKAGLGSKGFHMAFHYCTTSSPTPILPPSYDGMKYIVDIYKGFTQDTGYFLSSGPHICHTYYIEKTLESTRGILRDRVLALWIGIISTGVAQGH